MEKLVRILDLVGAPVDGLLADLRTRNADGSLRYEHTAEEGPRMRRLTAVEVIQERMYGKHKAKVPCLYWRWQKDGSMTDCGYSGLAIETEEQRKAAEEYYLLLKDAPCAP